MGKKISINNTITVPYAQFLQLLGWIDACYSNKLQEEKVVD